MAAKGDAAASEEQMTIPGGCSWSDDFGLEVHGCGIDATIAVDGSGEGGMALVGSKSSVLNEEELSTNSKQSVDCFATVNPRGGSTSYRLGCG